MHRRATRGPFEPGRQIPGWRRGMGGGAAILLLLIGVALILVLMFGNFGGKSYMQNVAGAKDKGEQLGIDMVARSLVQTITAERTMNPDATPTTFEELGQPASSFLDPWDNPVRWRYDNPDRPTKVIVTSDGPDGRPDTEDDVTVEQPLAL